ncbi:DUF4179 domain-containing protein [Clostridium sp. LY3-2]|uniref:DUF4179 domain-containing protein n=1 Tax=Clostridium sp. LY3-2 TaxID=2942482 RepID=UPI00215314F8|nr:DUF4179 domain-containing protein [Clostridium sp. LY3-2]MCR6515017.1 DUF4179 domain-containing protein [Clostridium sp. LY3-2]
MNNDFDKKIKALIEDGSNEIPKNIDDKINDTLNSLKKRNSIKREKKFLKIALLGLVVLCGTSFTVVSYATGEDVKDFVFNLLGRSDKYSSNANLVNQVFSFKGGTFKIKSVVYDGFTLNFTYEIKYNEDNLNKDEDININSDFKINGENRECNAVGGYSEKVDKNIRVGIKSIYLNDDWMSDIDNEIYDKKLSKYVGIGSEDFKLDQDINIGDEKFSLKTLVKNVSDKANVLSVGKIISNYKIKEVISTETHLILIGEKIKEGVSENQLEVLSGDKKMDSDSKVYYENKEKNKFEYRYIKGKDFKDEVSIKCGGKEINLNLK